MAAKIDRDIERLAARLACLCVKETTGKTQKWDKMEPVDRSLWRLLARAAMDEIGLSSRTLKSEKLPQTVSFLRRK